MSRRSCAAERPPPYPAHAGNPATLTTVAPRKGEGELDPPLRAFRTGLLELPRQAQDALDVGAAASIDSVPKRRAESLVVGRQGQRRVVQPVQVVAQQRRAHLGVVPRVVEVD